MDAALSPPAASGGPAAGLAHVLATTDAVGQALLAVLLVMSVLSWTLVAARLWTGWRRARASAAFLRAFMSAPSLAALRPAPGDPAGDEPYARLTARTLAAQEHHARHAGTRVDESGRAGEFLSRHLRQALDDEAHRLEAGLAALATVGATAPFVGLFGTVWGVYHALTAIGAAGVASLDQVAAPVGEALVMTGLGLAVAIPAVVAYNAFVRANRRLVAQMQTFAHELFTWASTGAPLGAPEARLDAAQPTRAHAPQALGRGAAAAA